MIFKTSPMSGYPGGKYKMLKYIVPLVNEYPFHYYCEPFCGGAAVYFGLKWHHRKSYCLNDLNDNILNFYLQGKNNPDELMDLINKRCVASKTLHAEAGRIFRGETAVSHIERAWAIWYLLKTSWQHILDKPFYPHMRTTNNLAYAAADMEEKLRALRYCALECMDGVEFIKRYDSKETLFYCDPPYVSTEQHHYDGYSQADFDLLLETLAAVKGGFILSHYNNPELRAWAADHGFCTDIIETKICLAMATKPRKREELLVYNYARKGLV